MDHKGDIQAIVDTVLCARNEDENRFISIIQTEIDSGKLKEFRKFSADCSSKAKLKRKRDADREAKEAEELAKELGLDKKGLKLNENTTEDELALMIQGRAQARFDAMIENIENKYASNSKKSSKAKKDSGNKKQKASEA